MTDITEARWLEGTPPLPSSLCSSCEALWHEGWALLQRAFRAPIGMLDDIWISVGQGYHVPAFGHWDIVHCVLDILSYDPALAGAAASLEKNGAILEFLHPSGGSISELTRKGDVCGPRRDYIGHNPVHAIAMMLADECPQANGTCPTAPPMRASEPAQ